MVKFNSIRANKLVAGMFVAQIWATKNRRIAQMVRVRKVIGNKINTGIEVVCDEFTASTVDGTLKTKVGDKMLRVTFGTITSPFLALPAPTAKEAVFDDAMKAVEQNIAKTEKRARKPLTEAQKARKNELARARRAAKKLVEA